jgi:beta-glucanase (GH16 family)
VRKALATAAASLILGAAACDTAAATATPTHQQAKQVQQVQPIDGIPGYGTWKLALDDEFNGTTLNSSIWSTGWYGSGITKGANSSETDCWDPANATVANGSLNLSLTQHQETCGGKTQPNTGAGITSYGKYSLSYGLIETRIYVPGNSSGLYDWPAVWTTGVDGNWPTSGEFDIAEMLGGQLCHNYHSSAGQSGPICESVTPGWHTVDMVWEPNWVAWWVDGTQVGQTTSNVVSSPQYLIANMSSGQYGGVTTPATLKIDYIRVWQ